MDVTQRDVVRDIVTAVAPHELSLLDGFESLDDAAVTRLLTTKRRLQRDPVGFGVADVAALITPVVWLVVDEVVRRGAGQAADGLFARGRAWLRGLFRRRRADSPRTVRPLTPEQLSQVHTQVVERATANGLAGPAAEALADAVVSRLARLPATTPPPTDPQPDATATG
ncbi:hypothetical protein [Allorhizocola rhizosphaerae]|uniref:hypothetical protein n=1 Tax=Allorhizocola rhizosphaerae TaxID=1872709 RepID=UPI0013C2F465|nr:hypothetical protein [Allorhizocola rhizosphaerae]